MLLIRKTTAYFLLALLASAASHADIGAPEVQQALHASVSPEDGFASDHVFTCQDRSIVRCDIDDNIIYLRQYIVDETQLNIDLSVFAHLDNYTVLAETNLTRLPASLSNVPTLSGVTIVSNGFAVPVIDGDVFPENIDALAIEARQDTVSLINWETQNLRFLTVNALEVDFNNTPIASLTHLNLANTVSLINEDFSGFSQVANFSWQQALENDKTAYYTSRAAFPLLSSEVVELELSRQYKEPILTQIPSYILDIPNLQSLTIGGHAITEVPAQLFAMPMLKHLNLSSNQITTLPAISENSTLESLSLMNNKLTHVPSAIFELTELRNLDLQGNQISSLPAELFAMDNLQELNARNNLIQDIAVMNPASTLKTLLLYRNKLSEVPVELFELNHLLTLDLTRNELATLPELVSNNAVLKTLRINENKISALPVSIFNHLSLQELQASHNELSSLPEYIVNSSIVSMDFTRNHFTKVPDELALFTGLKKADFSQNRIEDLAEQWKQSSSLEELLVSKNQLKSLTSSMLNNLPSSLKLLSLNNNEMVGELPSFTKINPELLVNISSNALWSTDTNVLLQYADSNVLSWQLLPVRGIRVVEKNVEGKLVSYIQWGFPLMQDVLDRTSGYHAANGAMLSGRLEGHFTEANPGPYISTGYRIVIEYTQGKKAGKIIKKTFSCSYLLVPLLCNLDKFSSSYDEDTYNSSVFSYGINGSLAGAKITVYSTSGGLSSSPTYWASTEKHEQFVNELEYDETELPAPDPLAGSIYFYHLLVLLMVGFLRIRFAK